VKGGTSPIFTAGQSIPWLYLHDVLTPRYTNTVHELTPENWAKARAASTAA